MRMAWLEVSRDTNVVSWQRGAALCRDTACDTATIRRPKPYDTAQGSCDTRGSARHDFCLAIQFCIMIREGCDTVGHDHDTVGHKHDTAGEGATIRLNVHHDTAPS